ncbi:hypothetical protein [Pelagibacterium sp. H642]|uniref:hypothetical protein n=1 Tax=Pelagibacterium sp. H642 TaxID=1881069 RepID=UPI0028163BE0|nr:hypothetical protein [Pelagibacterium sp. H642]WMT92567.1 hypothetical protein NO934_19665 [Pelagibacterium sp. H642]
MFKYDVSGSVNSIRAKSALRQAALTEWPNLSEIDLDLLERELDLVDAVRTQTGRTTAEAKQVVRNWMERHGLPPVDAEQLHNGSAHDWEKQGKSIRPRGPSLYRR